MIVIIDDDLGVCFRKALMSCCPSGTVCGGLFGVGIAQYLMLCKTLSRLNCEYGRSCGAVDADDL